MNLPEKFNVLIITLSDRAFRGDYEDLSGPAIRDRLSLFFSGLGWKPEFRMQLIPDDRAILQDLVSDSSKAMHLIFTTGGTGIGPRDITIEAVKPLLSKEIPGIMELIRVKYGAENPNALLSRGVAGVSGKSLVFTLPGSSKAVNEYMNEILKVLEHAIRMQYGMDSHPKH
jgi:molybdenum cofactor synthesis domain-containing protein